jgi:hypothetical protein
MNWQDNDGNFWIEWPGRRKLTSDQVMMAYSDAVANGDCEAGHDNTYIEAAQELDQAGLFTFGNSF